MGAFEATLIQLAEQGKAAAVQPPKISMRDFEKVGRAFASELTSTWQLLCVSSSWPAAIRTLLQRGRLCGITGCCLPSHCRLASTLGSLVSRLGLCSACLLVWSSPDLLLLSDLRCAQVLIRARPTVSTKDLVTHTNFTKEFGEEG